jgi:restriction system protein
MIFPHFLGGGTMPEPPFQGKLFDPPRSTAHHAGATFVGQGSLTLMLHEGARKANLSLFSIIIPEIITGAGTLVRATSLVWNEIVQALGNDWALAYQIPPEKWEEIVAGAFKKANYDEVTLTPRSRDHGRDIIAIKRGVGCVKILGSVKRYAPNHLVEYDDIRALLGVLSGERDASKGIITTTSDFPPRVMEDPNISPFIPTRLELMNREALLKWLLELAADKK